MTYFELISNEITFVDKLKANEKIIYTANSEQLLVLKAKANDYFVTEYVDVALLINELHRKHQQYNDIMEVTDDLYETDKARRNLLDKLDTLNEQSFIMNIAIGYKSVVLSLTSTDECDALYNYLSTLKMNRFDIMADNYDVELLAAWIIDSTTDETEDETEPMTFRGTKLSDVLYSNEIKITKAELLQTGGNIMAYELSVDHDIIKCIVISDDLICAYSTYDWSQDVDNSCVVWEVATEVDNRTMQDIKNDLLLHTDDSTANEIQFRYWYLKNL